jgi:hypothetical protein
MIDIGKSNTIGIGWSDEYNISKIKRNTQVSILTNDPKPFKQS